MKLIYPRKFKLPKEISFEFKLRDITGAIYNTETLILNTLKFKGKILILNTYGHRDVDKKINKLMYYDYKYKRYTDDIDIP